MGDIRDIVSRLLSSQGALVEPIEPDGLEVVAPPPVQDLVGIEEFSRLGFGAELPVDAVRVSLESDFVDKLGLLLGERGTGLSVLVGEHHIQWPSSPERILEHEIMLANATYRFTHADQEASTRYLLLVFHVTAISDEKREDMLSVCLNESNSAYADHLITPSFDHLTQADLESVSPRNDPGTPWTSEQVRIWCSRFLPARIRARLSPFLAGMERRMSRDLERLFSYHTDLRGEALARLEKGKTKDPASMKREGMRIEAIEREYLAKTEELTQRYAMSVDVRLVQLLRVVMPVYRLHVDILRRKGRRNFHLDWNPLSRRLDNLPCESCGMASRTHYVCDDHLHLLCPDCMAPCSKCQKRYCDACHPRTCPRCGHVNE